MSAPVCSCGYDPDPLRPPCEFHGMANWIPRFDIPEKCVHNIDLRSSCKECDDAGYRVRHVIASSTSPTQAEEPMTTEPQPAQPTEQIDPRVRELVDLCISWQFSDRNGNTANAARCLESMNRSSIELSKRLAGPSLTVIEWEIRRVVEGWWNGSDCVNELDGGIPDLVDMLRDAFVELQKGKP